MRFLLKSDAEIQARILTEDTGILHIAEFDEAYGYWYVVTCGMSRF